MEEEKKRKEVAPGPAVSDTALTHFSGSWPWFVNEIRHSDSKGLQSTFAFGSYLVPFFYLLFISFIYLFIFVQLTFPPFPYFSQQTLYSPRTASRANGKSMCVLPLLHFFLSFSVSLSLSPLSHTHTLAARTHSLSLSLTPSFPIPQVLR